jgi:hypothetical protein
MSTVRHTNIAGLNTYLNPLNRNGIGMIRAVNVVSYPYGAKTKRSGYTPIGTVPSGTTVTDLFSWEKGDGSKFLYASSGGNLYCSIAGTGSFSACTNGAVSGTVSHDVLNDTLVIADGVGSTRHTTNGTAFTDTILAPVMVSVAMFQNRIYGGGTASTLFYSSANDATNWSTSGTSDSNSLQIPGAGRILSVFASNDRLLASKTSGMMYKWDGYSLLDMSTDMGPTSPKSLASHEGNQFWFNDHGIMGYNGARPENMSVAVQPMIFNTSFTGITGTQLLKIPATCHKFTYYSSIGTVTDDVTGYSISDCVMRYDVQKNELLTWKMANAPTAWTACNDINNDNQLYFGDDNGIIYKVDGTVSSDNGSPIESIMEFIIDLDKPEDEKKWDWLTMFFNPGCQAKVAYSCSNTFVKDRRDWKEMGDCTSGVMRFRFPADSRSRLLFIRIYENSKDSGFSFYGMTIKGDVIEK